MVNEAAVSVDVAQESQDGLNPRQREIDELRTRTRIDRARAAVLRSQVVQAYGLLADMRLGGALGDTAFRDGLVEARRGLEYMLSDYLLDDAYWKKRLEEYGDQFLQARQSVERDE